jgi:hypothetical protein
MGCLVSKNARYRYTLFEERNGSSRRLVPRVRIISTNMRDGVVPFFFFEETGGVCTPTESSLQNSQYLAHDGLACSVPRTRH